MGERTEIEMPTIERVEAVQLREDDILIVTLPRYADPEQCELVKRKIGSTFGLDRRVIVKTTEVNVEVVHSDDSRVDSGSNP